MGRFSSLMLSAVVLAVGMPNMARAADLLPPVYEPPPKVHKWYLRGHIGMSNQHLGSLYHPRMDDPQFFEWLNEGDFESAPIFGVGFGMYHGERMRFDIVGEYRGKSGFHALDRYDESDAEPDFDSGDPDDWGINDYTARKSEFLIMANAYADIGTWHGVTPYVGAGIGASYNVISGYLDNNLIQGGGGYADSAGTWNLAWALHAGIGFKASENVTVDLGYSFLNLGNAETDTVYNQAGGCGVCSPAQFRNITSHDLKLTVRYDFNKQPKWPVYSSYTPPAVVKY